MVTQHGAQRDFIGQRLALLQLGEHRGFVQPAAQVYRHQAKHPAQQERDAPGVVGHLGDAVQAVDQRRNQGTEQDARRQTRRQRAAGIAYVARRHVLGHEYPGARHFTTNGSTLDHAHQQQQDRRPQADLRVGWQQAHDQRRHGHHEDAQGEHLLAAQQVAEVRHDDAAQGAGQVAGGKDAEGLHQAQPLGHVGGKKQFADHGGKKHENNEIVELQRSTQGGKRQSLVVVAGQGTRRLRVTGGHGGHEVASLIGITATLTRAACGLAGGAR